MSSIVVKALPPTAAGRLYPQLDPEINFLLLKGSTPIASRHQVHVSDGVITFGLDERLLLRKGALRRTWDRWTIVEPFPDWTTLGDMAAEEIQDADIEFSQETVSTKYFSDVQVETVTDRSITRLWLGLGENEGSGRLLRLSEHCLALLEDDRLVGFYVGLTCHPRADPRASR